MKYALVWHGGHSRLPIIIRLTLFCSYSLEGVEVYNSIPLIPVTIRDQEHITLIHTDMPEADQGSRGPHPSCSCPQA